MTTQIVAALLEAARQAEESADKSPDHAEREAAVAVCAGFRTLAQLLDDEGTP
jgi:hypothetical protein